MNTLHLERTAARDDDLPPVLHLRLSADPTVVHALSRTEEGWRLEDLDADTLDPRPGTALVVARAGIFEDWEVSDDGRLAVVALREGEVTHLLMVVRDAGVVRVADAPRLPSVRVACSRDGTRFAVWGGYVVRELDARAGVVLREVDAWWHAWDGVSLLVAPDDAAYAVCDADGAVRGRWMPPEGWSLDGAEWSGDALWVACLARVEGSGELDRSRLRVSLHARDGREVASLERSLARPVGIMVPRGDALVLTDEIGLSAVVRREGDALTWSAPEGLVRPPTLGAIHWDAWSRDGTRFAGRVGAVAFALDTARGHAALVREGPTGMVTSLALSPDGRSVAATWRGGTAKVLEADTLDARWTFEDGHAWLEACAWAPDGARLYTASEQHVRAWCLATGDELWSVALEGVDNPTRAASLDLWTLHVSPDGATALVLGRDERERRDYCCGVDLAVAAASWWRHVWEAPPARDEARPVAVVWAPATDCTLVALDLVHGEVTAQAEYVGVQWEGGVAPEGIAARGLVLPDDGDVAVYEPVRREPREPWPTQLVAWRMRDDTARVVACDPGYAVTVTRGLVVRVEFPGTDAQRLAVYDLARLERIGETPLPRPHRISALVVSPDLRAMYVGTARGAVLRYAIRHATA